MDGCSTTTFFFFLRLLLSSLDIMPGGKQSHVRALLLYFGYDNN
jgi:hypothetical protein